MYARSAAIISVLSFAATEATSSPSPRPPAEFGCRRRLVEPALRHVQRFGPCGKHGLVFARMLSDAGVKLLVKPFNYTALVAKIRHAVGPAGQPSRRTAI